MCGVPFHSADSYIARLVAKGYKVAICEQLEDPALAKGIVKRDVIRVVTPGTVIENSMLDESRNNYLACVCVGEDGAGLCFADVSTGEVHLTDFSADGCEDALMNEFGRYMPSEVLMNAGAAVLPKFKSFLSKRMNLTAELLEDEQFDLAACTGLVLSHFQKARSMNWSFPARRMQCVPLASRSSTSRKRRRRSSIIFGSLIFIAARASCALTSPHGAIWN